MTELSSDEIWRCIQLMNSVLPKTDSSHDIAQMQATECGQYTEKKSLPRFLPVTHKEFIQIINNGDHWVCVTNVFSDKVNHVYVYDSYPTPGGGVNDSIVIQISSLLRLDDAYEIKFLLREFDRQTAGTRLCGFYAVAAAFSICCLEDPTGLMFDEPLMRIHLQDCLTKKTIRPFPAFKTGGRTYALINHPKLLCICNQTSTPSSQRMIKCDKCHNWYHDSCVGLSTTSTPIRERDAMWHGPCCKPEAEMIALL